MRLINKAFACATFIVLATPAFSFKKKEVPKAPLPPVIRNARIVFLTNAGGSGTSLAFDEFYAEMKRWGNLRLPHPLIKPTW